MRTVLLFFFILSQFSLLAQQRLNLKTNPIYLLSDQRYTLPVALEYGFGNFSIQAEQILLVTKYNNYSLRENLNYSKTNLQLRYHLKNALTEESSFFVGLHGTVRNYDYIESQGSFISGEGRNISYKNSNVETRNYGAYAISGVQLQSRRGILFELVFGFGIRELSVQHDSEEITFQEFLDPFLFENLEEQWREGTRTIPGLLVQMRFGYTLFGGKKKG